MKVHYFIFSSVFLVLAVCTAFGRNHEHSAAVLKPHVEDMSQGPVKVIITADPSKVQLDRDILLTITITSPSEIDVSLPALDDRLQGFILNGVFDEEPRTHGGETTLERHARLTPGLAGEYRLAPMAIKYTDRSTSPASAGWFATRPMVFEAVPPFEGRPGKDIEATLEPVWIYPPFKTVALYSGLVILVVIAVILAWKLLKRVRHNIQLARMSPRERAMKELAILLAKDLPGKNMIKEFYLELTMIVRRYIESAHSIRAPEQTTQEFLIAVSDNPRFGPTVVKKLKAFLEAADLVKFAAHQPPDEAVKKAIDTAREYIESDDTETKSGD